MNILSTLLLISACLGSVHGGNKASGNLRRLETPAEDCEEVKLEFTYPKFGGTALPQNPLNIVSQDTETVTVELTNPFSQTLAAAYFQYEKAPRREYECNEYKNFSVTQVETVTLECSAGRLSTGEDEPFAIVTLFVADPTAVSGNAEIPKCCQSDTQDDPDPAMSYTFVIACVPKCLT